MRRSGARRFPSTKSLRMPSAKACTWTKSRSSPRRGRRADSVIISGMFRDGPLSRRPREEIRYGTGKSAVGPVLVAASDKGIVTIMVLEKQDQLIRDIRARFPKADVQRDEKGCAAIVAKVVKYIAAPVGRFKPPLDIRGTELQQRVWREVRKIP